MTLAANARPRGVRVYPRCGAQQGSRPAPATMAAGGRSVTGLDPSVDAALSHVFIATRHAYIRP